MKLDWALVKSEILSFKTHDDLSQLSPLAEDVLYGSMWGLNFRFMTLRAALEKNKPAMIEYALQRMNTIINKPPIHTKRQPVPRCRVGYGTYGWRYDQRIIEMAIENDILIDTASGYGYGRTETELGKIFNRAARPITVFTKVRRDNMSPTAIMNAVERSNEKLKTTPHVQIHFPHNKHPNAVIHLAKLRQQGKLKSIGLSNCSVDMVEHAQMLLSSFSGDIINVVQIPFNLRDTRASKTIIPYCRKKGILVLAYNPLGQNFKKLQTPYLQSVAKKYNATPAQIALAWILSYNGVMPIPNTNNSEHMRQNLEASTLVLEDDDVMKLKEYYETC